MAGALKLATTLVGGIVMLSALNARGWQSSNVSDNTRQETSGVPASTVKRTPADMPPNSPKVTCEGGKLTISATNSTFGAVLNAIRSCTGTEIEVPEGARQERLFAELGPGSVRAVLADFLSSTDFDYVIKASPLDPQKVQMVLISLRHSDSTPGAVTEVANNGDGNVSTNHRAWLEARHNYQQSFSPPDEEPTQPAETVPSASPSTETPAPSTNSTPAGAEPVNPAPAAPAIALTPEGEVSSAATGSADTPGQGKTTQDMIGDMQQMFEKRKQMIQQQPATVH
jgi:hypothetical protein